MDTVLSVLIHYLYLGIFTMIIIIMSEPPLKRRDWLPIILCLIVWPLTTFFFVTDNRYLRNGK